MTQNKFFDNISYILGSIPGRITKFSITKKIALSVLIMIGFVIATLNFYSAKIVFPNVLKSEKQKISTIVNYIAQDIEVALDFGSKSSVEHILSSLSSSSHILGVYFRNEDYHINKMKKYKNSSIELFVDANNKPYFAAHKQINGSDFVLYYDALSYLNTIYEYKHFILLLSIILFTIMFLSLFYFKLLLLPFTKTAKIMLEIDLENPTFDKSLLEINTKDERGEIVYAFLQMIKKITLRTRELDVLNATLEEKVQMRTQKLQDAMQALGTQKRDVTKTLKKLRLAQAQLIETEKMASLGALVAGVAHEINTPIGISYTGITHLMRSTESLLDSYENNEMTKEDFDEYFEDTKEFQSVINSNIIRAANLIKSFKQIAVDQSSEQIREFNVYDYINETLLSLKNHFKNRNINVNLICDKSLKIKSYPGIWSQILTNLILNSLLHAFDKNDFGLIHIEVNRQENRIIIDYKDNGKGIAKENLKHIFEPFFTTARSKGGSGLGLHIIYNIVTSKLKGTIKSRSTLGQGVHFVINMPIKTKET